MRVSQVMCAIGLLALAACNRNDQRQPELADPQAQAELDKVRAELREAEKDPEFNKSTEQARRSAHQNMQNMGKALIEYEKTHPPQYDENGVPLKAKSSSP